MPLFYFHLRVGSQRSPDDLGVEFDSAEAAYLDAFATAREMWSELLKNREDPTTHSFEICNDNGELLFILPLRLRNGAKSVPFSSNQGNQNSSTNDEDSKERFAATN
jgi:Domain of unknown function (DUF6894)